jgi:molybdate transport system substrate-binding protein
MTGKQVRRSARGLGAVLAAAAAVTTGSCATAGDDSTATPVRVFAAASVNNVGDDLAEAFAAEHHGAAVEYTFAGSSALVRQLGQGADADLFISADQENMDSALALDAFTGAVPRVIATNRLVLVTAPGNPLGLSSPRDLATVADGRIALCADGVPCGTLAHRFLDATGTGIHDNWTVSEEANVSDVSTKIATGEVDAGFIYSTDALALQRNSSDTGPDGRIDIIDLGDTVEPNTYPAALTTDGQDDPAARDFLDWLSSDTAREILGSYGFGTA